MIADIYELSPLQSGMLFHRTFAPESTAYFDQFSCRLSGAVDAPVLARAWQRLVDRHGVLRTSFHWEGLDKPVQVVHTAAALPCQVLDWRGVSSAEQQARWEAFLADDRARGFQPDVAPLMRIAIARVGEREYLFCWSHHHLLLDGWCLSLVLSEVFATYEALLNGQEPALPPVRPFREYIAWLQRRDRGAMEQYWRDALRGFAAATPILDSAARAGSGGSSADRTIARRLPADATEALRAQAATHRLTLNTLVQGAWALVLSRYSGSDDVVFGATTSGRPPDVPGIETMLGVFINTVPVRVGVSEDVAASAWLSGIQAAHVTRDEFAALPLSEIQKLSSVDAGSPLFTSNVIVMNYRLDDGLAKGAAGFEIRDVRIVDQTDIPLTLQVTPGRELTLEILYDSARFSDDSARRMLGHVEHVLAQLAGDLARPLSALDIVTPAEREEIVWTFNATEAPLDRSQTALDLFDARVAETPNAVALECDGRQLTFTALNALAERIANGLSAAAPVEAPLGKDRLVAIAFARSEWLVAAILAVWKTGSAYLPIDPNYPPDRIRQILDTASPSVVMRDDGTLDADLERQFADRARFIAVRELDRLGESAAHRTVRCTGADLAYVIFTSGSTGLPKGAMVEHTGMLNHLLAKIEDLHLDARSVIVQNASHCFDISVWQCFAAILAGGRTLVYTDELVLDPASFLSRVRRDRVTVLEVVPSYLTPLLDQADDDPRPLDDLQFLLVTGETVKPALVARWFARFPSIPVVNAYGPTEASDDITHAFLHEPPASPSVPIGRPIRNFHIYIVDGGGRLCPVGVAGELCVSGPGVGRGYFNDAARTAAVFGEDPFRSERGVRMYRTGDVGWFTADGTVFLAGRRDYQVKIRGYRIELGDIEAALAGIAGVRDAVVVDRQSDTRTTVLAAYVTLRAGSTLSSSDILDALADRVPEYMIPASCAVMAELPLTPNGKIDRKALPTVEAARGEDRETYAAPRTDAEAALAAIWSSVIGIDRPGIHDNFFSVGGDSILSMQIVSRAARAGFALTPRDVFQYQTIAELAQRASDVAAPGGVSAGADARAATASRASLRRAASGPAPLAPAQRQFFADVTVDRHHYNQSILLETREALDTERLRRAFNAVLERHDALRLRFVESDGEWRQQVAPFEPQSVARHDVSSIPAEARAAAVADIGASLQSSLDLAHGPLGRAAHIDFGAGAGGRVLLVVHHLAVDGVSWRALLDDFASAYAAADANAVIALPEVGTSYLEWASAQPVDAIAPPPSDSRNTVASATEFTLTLDETLTRAFSARAGHARGSGATEMLLAAMGLAYRDWAPAVGDRVPIDVETHGRDVAGSRQVGADVRAFDLSRTVGWFTRTSTIVLDLPDAQRGRADVIVQAAGALGAVRNSAGASSVTNARGARAPILLNYHGRVESAGAGGGARAASDVAWRISEEPHGPDRSGKQLREYAIDVNALVAGGQLRIAFTYSTNVHDEREIASLARQLESHLVRIVQDADVEDVYPLSPTQEGLLFHALAEPATGAYFNQLTCVLNGDLDIDAFKRAWQHAIDRHAVLRTSFHWHGLERPVQAVRPGAEMPWLVEDWTDASGSEPSRWRALCDTDRQHPFDLSAAPLMRAMLVRTGARAWRFLWSQHHLLLDGWSSSIVLGDVLAAYDAIVNGRPVTLPVPPPFRAHIDWLERQDAGATVRFWRERLAGFDTPTPLMLGMPEMNGDVSSGRFADAEAELPAALAARLTAAAAANRVTIGTLFHGAWALLLSRYSGSADVVFGSIVSGRSTSVAGSDRMVGLFINTVPVRARIGNDREVFDWLRELQQSLVESEPHSYASLADVQRESDVPGGAALFDSIVIVENYPAGADDRARALQVEDVRAFEPNNYPLTFVVTPGRSIGLKIMFDEGRFDRATIERALGHLLAMLDGVAGEAGRSIGGLPLLTPGELTEIARWNATDVADVADVADGVSPHSALAAQGATVPALIAAHARSAPDRPALLFEGGVTTYRDLEARANQLARVLRARGVNAGEDQARVVVMLGRSDRLVEAILAVWKCGAVYVPVDPEFPAARVQAIIENARPAAVIADTRTPSGAAASVGAAFVLLGEPLDRLAAAPADPGHPALDPSQLAYVIYTSGSTGMPKGAMIEHAGFLNHVRSMIDDLGLTPARVVAQTASQSFDISMWQMFAALVAGGTTAIYPDALVRRPEALAAQLAADRVAAAQFVPSYLSVFLDALSSASEMSGARHAAIELPDLRHMVTIGEALTPALVARWFRLFPRIPLMNAYGPTEASDSVAHATFTAPRRDALVPIGRPIRNIRLYVLDAAMRLCPIGVKGEICIAGVGVGRGYLFDEERTRAAFGADPFRDGARLYRTGDIGCYRPDGMLLFFGRRDHQVKVRGHRIELGEIESALMAIDGVREAAVVVHERGGDRLLCAYVTTPSGAAGRDGGSEPGRRSARRIDAEQIAAQLAGALPHHARPDVVTRLDVMPVMANGKIDRRALAARPVGAADGDRQAEPESETERAIAGVWSAVLARDGIGRDDSFFDLGGHSLKAIQIVSRLRRDLGIDAGVGDVFERPTIRRLAALADERRGAPAAATPPRPTLVARSDQEFYDVSATQSRIWLASRTPEGSAAYNMAGAFWLDGDVDERALSRAFNALVERHEALRTVFEMRDGRLRQRVVAAREIGDVTACTDMRSQQAELDRVVRQRIATPFDLSRGPLAAVDLFQVSDTRRLLLVRLHHIVGDAASIRVLLNDARQLYAAFTRGAAVSPLAPLPVQFRDFVAWQHAQLADPGLETSRRYWQDVLRELPPRAGFEPDTAAPRPLHAVSAAGAAGAGSAGSAASVGSAASNVATSRIDAALASQLRRVAAAHDTTLFAVIVSAVYALLYRHRAQDDLVIGSTISRRDHPWLEAQVGCYIDTLVLRGRVQGSDTAPALLARTAQVCRQALAHRDYPLDALVSELGITSPPGKPLLVDVLVDYTPVPRDHAGAHEDAGFRITEYEHGSDAAHYDTMFVVGESDSGDDLAIQLVFDASRFSVDTAERIAGRVTTILAWLASDSAAVSLAGVDLAPAPNASRRRLRVSLNTS